MKIKICPVCGFVNPPNELDCQRSGCNTSLIDVPLSDAPGSSEVSNSEIVEAAEPSGTEKPSSEKSGLYRICPSCHQHTPPNTYRCKGCGRTLYEIPLVNRETEAALSEKINPAIRFILRSEDGKASIPVCDGEAVIIGREANGFEYLSDKLFVGRKHISIQQNSGIVYITDLNSTNGTLVNGAPIKKNKPFKLSENDLISLGAREGQAPVDCAAYFTLMKAVDPS